MIAKVALLVLTVGFVADALVVLLQGGQVDLGSYLGLGMVCYLWTRGRSRRVSTAV